MSKQELNTRLFEREKSGIFRTEQSLEMAKDDVHRKEYIQYLQRISARKDYIKNWPFYTVINLKGKERRELGKVVAAYLTTLNRK
ncbi:hypothetical protein [Persicobacter diffluens]|uniref:Uncharacterized protein n=1 Tax=Persicobacter diffluens TaxID=981 RepID=A0AAN4W660_9BACT|nr:hypothetical protein PEDI_53870 [Persicobacter diffluens]